MHRSPSSMYWICSRTPAVRACMWATRSAISPVIFMPLQAPKGFNVLHPMGFDAFGLPSRTYALETGQHPAVTTEKNIARYHEQLDNIGFCYDWSREVRTSDANIINGRSGYFFNCFIAGTTRKRNKAKPIAELIAIFEKEGNINTPWPVTTERCALRREWKHLPRKQSEKY